MSQEIDEMRYDALQRIGLPGDPNFTAHQAREGDEMTTIASTQSLSFASLSDTQMAHYEVDHHVVRSDDTSDEEGDEDIFDHQFVLWGDTSDEEGDEEFDGPFAAHAGYYGENWNFIVRAAGHLLNVAALAFGAIYRIPG
ncbi:hypothetical protein V8C35DRAFT_275057 [Trichoderma chlorosporum]